MQLPGPVRAAIGLAANVAQEARHLPDRAIELPMLAVSTALQMSLRAQQRYAMLEAKGDEVLGGARVTDDPPPWATFDDPPTDESLQRLVGAGDDRDAAAILDEIFGGLEDDLTPPTPITSASGTGARKSAAKRAAAKKDATKNAAKKGAAKKAPGKSSGKSSGKAELRTDSEGKGVNKPKHTSPSKFDDAD